ncbi:MAG TPA: hypothetical protein VE983_07080 [Solirubrobacteraceae bacterium]|nr:hypothetical protein [Solirubrobacteraceae bacterium]
MRTSKITRWAAERSVLARLASSLLIAMAALVLMCPAARGDGDPASDVLLGQNVFYPYLPHVSGGLQATLNAETAAAAHAHFPIKVALIAGPSDLGVVPELFAKPQAYASFLGQELRLILGPHTPLLVVMPDGYGARELPPAAQTALRTLPKPRGTQTNDLARAAIVAVRRLASAAGHPISGRSNAANSGAGSGGGTVTIVIVALVAAGAAGGILLLRRRVSPRRSARR